MRTLNVSGSPAVVGDGPEEGENGPLPQGANYTCSVSAYNAAGDGPPESSGSFVVPAVINTEKNQAYSTIQAAIDDSNDGDTITVGRGTFQEFIDINPSITLLGPNAGISPYNDAKDGVNPSRKPEAVIEPPDDDTSQYLIRLDNEDVTFKGFYVKLPLVDRDDGGPVDFGMRVGFLNATAEDNIFEGGSLNNAVVRAFRSLSTCTSTGRITGASFKRNLVVNTLAQAFILQCTTGSVEDNVVLNAAVGLQIQPYTSEGTGIIQNNKFDAYVYGVWFNYWDGTGNEANPVVAAKWEMKQNMVTKVAALEGYSQSVWYGLRFETVPNNIAGFEYDAAFIKVSENTIDAGGSTNETITVAGAFFRNYNIPIDGSLQLTNNTFNGFSAPSKYIDALSGTNDNTVDLIEEAGMEALLASNTFASPTEIEKPDGKCCQAIPA